MDRSHSKVARNVIPVLEELILKEVPYVHNLYCNLLLISKLIQNHNYSTKSYSNLSEFQDLDFMRMIGNAKVYYGLFFL